MDKSADKSVFLWSQVNARAHPLALMIHSSVGCSASSAFRSSSVFVVVRPFRAPPRFVRHVQSGEP